MFYCTVALLVRLLMLVACSQLALMLTLKPSNSACIVFSDCVHFTQPELNVSHKAYREDWEFRSPQWVLQWNDEFTACSLVKTAVWPHNIHLISPVRVSLWLLNDCYCKTCYYRYRPCHYMHSNQVLVWKKKQGRSEGAQTESHKWDHCAMSF